MQVIHQAYHQGRRYSEKHLVALVLADIHNAVPELLKQSAEKRSLTLPQQGTFEHATLNPTHPMSWLLHAYVQLDEFRVFELFADKGLCPYGALLLNADASIHIRSILLFREFKGCSYVQVPFLSLSKVKRLWRNLRALSQEKSFKTALNAYNRVMKERLVNYHDYVHSLFAYRARLLLLRVDLGYGEGNVVSYDEFREDLDHFIGLIQSNPIFRSLMGHIWTIEHGNGKGYHTHLLFFYDGSRHHADRYIAEQIGDLWMQISKQANPIYFNCNTKKNKKKYQICCIGEVHRDDLPKIACLHEQLIPYLLKVDEFLRLTKVNSRRLTGRGVLLRVSSSIKSSFKIRSIAV